VDRFADAAAYEGYIGRWSRLVAAEFLAWLGVRAGARWLDVGCGTGALIDAILARSAPAAVYGIDRSPELAGATAARLAAEPRARVTAGDAEALPPDIPADLDAAVSGLVLNFIPRPERALAEMARVSRGVVAAYVWDYGGGMELLRRFWDAAAAVDPAAGALDEAVRFPLCRPAPLGALFAGLLADVEVRAIDVPMRFVDFDDLWTPFLGAQGPAPSYVATLDEARKIAVRERLRVELGPPPFELHGRAWAARGQVRG
jgi:SAM-dependent methyltransferase